MFFKFNFNFLKYLIVLSLLGFSLSFSQNKEVKDVLCEGYGRDINEAAQNCAENALTNVVGSFMDTSSSLEVRTNISNGIKNQTRFIKKDVKEYSQGVIQKFEILRVSTEKLYKVDAKVSVRIDDFKYYIKKFAEAEVNVNEGLFAQIKTEKNQSSNGAAIIFEKILSPLIKGEVIDFKLSPPKPLSNIDLKGFDGPGTNFSIFKDNNKDLFIVGFRVNVQAKNEYLINTQKILNSIASKKIDYGTVKQNSIDSFMIPRSNQQPAFQEQDVYIVYSEANKNEYYSSNLNGYLINSIKNELDKNKMSLLPYRYNYARPEMKSVYSVPIPLLRITIFDNNKSILQQENIQDAYFKNLNKSRYFILEHYYKSEFNSPWSLAGGYGGKFDRTYLIRDSNEFVLFIAVNENTLKNAKVINLKISE